MAPGRNDFLCRSFRQRGRMSLLLKLLLSLSRILWRGWEALYMIASILSSDGTIKCHAQIIGKLMESRFYHNCLAPWLAMCFKAFFATFPRNWWVGEFPCQGWTEAVWRISSATLKKDVLLGDSWVNITWQLSAYSPSWSWIKLEMADVGQSSVVSVASTRHRVYSHASSLLYLGA